MNLPLRGTSLIGTAIVAMAAGGCGGGRGSFSTMPAATAPMQKPTHVK